MEGGEIQAAGQFRGIHQSDGSLQSEGEFCPGQTVLAPVPLAGVVAEEAWPLLCIQLQGMLEVQQLEAVCPLRLGIREIQAGAPLDCHSGINISPLVGKNKVRQQFMLGMCMPSYRLRAPFSIACKTSTRP